MVSSIKFLPVIAVGLAILGCKSTNQPQFAEIEGSTTPRAASSAESSPPAPAPTGAAKIIIKGTKAGTSQQDIALALMTATRKLGTTRAAPDRENEMRQARQAADAILGGDKVVLEGASPDSVESIAEDLRKAGLLVTTSK